MIDFHTHILPGMDDGAADVRMSLEMLRSSARQGVDVVCATSHFYAYEESPDEFLERRSEAFAELMNAVSESGDHLPRILPGAEVLYFPGISQSDEISKLVIENTHCLLIEPTMTKWSETMLDEIEETGIRNRCIPIVAHIDRYMRVLDDNSLVERVSGRRLVVQVNASFFARPDTSKLAVRLMNEGKIHLLGSDCHNMDDRRPNIKSAAKAADGLGMLKQFAEFNKKAYIMLG